jgi:alpha-2-macroglobulin
MKSLFLLVGSLLLTLPGLAQDPGDADAKLEKVLKLAEAGNRREAADLAKAVLAPNAKASPEARANALSYAQDSLSVLSAFDEAEKTLEKAVADFPNEWRVLQRAGALLHGSVHYGYVVDGIFHRGSNRDQGQWKSCQLRDRVRMLQLCFAAWEKIQSDPQATAYEKSEVINWIILGLSPQNRGASSAWQMQILTDLSKLPDYDEQEGNDEPANGYPVNEQGEPIFFEASSSLKTAASDGQRLFYLFNELAGLGNEFATKATRQKADLLASWFSVRSLAYSGLWGRATADEAKSKEGIAALHTLKDDETIAKLATGPKRFALPEGQSFLRLYQKLADDESVARTARAPSLMSMATELTDRRQYGRAASLLKTALEWNEEPNLEKILQHQLDQITGNLARLEPSPAQPAGKGAKLSLVFRNATKIAFTARKVDVLKLAEDTKAWLRTEPQDREDWWRGDVNSIGRRLLEKDQQKYLGDVVARWETALEPAADHWDKRMEIATSLQNGGAYFIEGKVENGNTARALLWIEDLVIVELKQSNQQLYALADAVTGAAVAEADATFFGYRREWKDAGIFRKKPTYNFSFREFSDQPDASGVIQLGKAKLDDDYQWLVVAKDAKGRYAVKGFEGIYFSGYEEYTRNESIYAVTDRPVYRPAQTVKWKAWARAAGYDPKTEHNRWAGKTFEVEINNPRGEKVFEQKMTADELGSISGELILAEDATLGSYSINFSRRSDVSASHHFRVEEYKKPEFEVTVKAPEKPVALGETFEVTVKADYYFGGPVKEGKVKYRIERTEQKDRWFPGGRWDWLFGEGYGWRTQYYDWYPGASLWCKCIAPWPWMPWRSDPPELVASGEKTIGADGTIKIQVDTALAKEIHGDQDHKYAITAEVTDSSRRMIVGNGTVLTARRPFEVYVWMDRGYYRSGEDGSVRLAAKTLDGSQVSAQGKIKVLRVTYADGKPVEKEVANFDAKTNDEGEVTQRVKWDKAGQYRISALLKDEGGHEIEGVAFVTVRGEDLNNGNGLKFDDLELAVEKDEYSPGDEVEVLINTNRENARVALFVRAANGIYPDPVWIQMDGKSATHRFKVAEKDQPNFFIEAFTVSDAKVHRVTKQIIVPPSKHIATVELITDKKEYLPQQKPAVKLRVKHQNGQPFVGDVILTGYDKALEYISGGSNQRDIREFFWSWKRSHNPSIQDSFRFSEVGLMKDGEMGMQGLGMFGDTADSSTLGFATSATGGGFGAAADSFAAKAPMPVMAPAARAGGMLSRAFKKEAANTLSYAAAPAAPPAEVPEGPAPMIRSNLADSAVWIANVKTNEQGEAAFDFALPDNLTTWNLRSWVMGPQTQVGEAKVEIVTRKNLMVRLQAPRFFVEKDEVVISANVHNEMDKAQNVDAVLELAGGCLEMMSDGKMPSLLVAAHSEKRVDWRVKVIAPGEATLRVKAVAQDDSDAMEMKFPVYVHGALKTDSWSLALRPDQPSAQIKMKVPAERRPEATRLEVRYSPTLAMSLVDALPYLTDYPYGCTEQTLNRFVPTVITLGVLKDLGVDLKAIQDKRVNLNAQEIGDAEKRGKRWQGLNSKGKPKQPVFDEAEVKRMARAGLQRLEAMRNADGGWGWFPGGRESSEHITAIVLHGLHVARESGADVPEDLIQSAVRFLQAHENEELRKLRLPEKDDHHKVHPDNLDALVHSVLVEQKQGDQEMRERLYEHRLKLSRYNQALLGLACHAKGEKDRRDLALRNLRQFLKEDPENQTAYLDLAGGSWWYWYDDEIETQALFLRLLVAVEPKGNLAPQVAKYLLNNRRNGTYWNSTKDTAAVIESLAAFVKASGESDPSAKVEVLVDGQKKKEVTITRENLFAFDSTLVLEGDELGSEHLIELRRDGKSPLYANAYLTVFSKEDMIPAAGLEVKVRRAFYRLIEEKPDTNVSGARGQVVKQQGFKYSRVAIASDVEIKSGDLIEVELTVESKNDYEYVIIEDMKPAGYEPVEVRSGWNWTGLQSYQEFRDEKVSFFAQRLPRGTHNLSYRVKAEIPGRFSALPARAEAMYAPELKGNSDEFKARVVEP